MEYILDINGIEDHDMSNGNFLYGHRYLLMEHFIQSGMMKKLSCKKELRGNPIQ